MITCCHKKNIRKNSLNNRPVLWGLPEEQWSILKKSRRSPGDISRNFPGSFPEMFKRFPRDFREMSMKLSGYVLEISLFFPSQLMLQNETRNFQKIIKIPMCRQVVILTPLGCFWAPFLFAWAPFLASLLSLGMRFFINFI